MGIPEDIKKKWHGFRYWMVLALLLGFAVASFFKGMQVLTITLFLSFIAWVYWDKITLTRAQDWLSLFSKIKAGPVEAEIKSPAQQAEVATEIEGPAPTEDAKRAFDDGGVFLTIGENTAAIKEFEEAVRIAPSFSDAYLNLGAAYLGLWHKTHQNVHLEKSIEASRKSLELSPHGYRNRINLAIAYSMSKEMEPEALKLYEEANEKGTYEDPLTWGKVKLFMANMIITLALRQDGEKYRKRFPEAVELLIASKHLFGRVSNQEALKWKKEAEDHLDSIKAATTEVLRERGKENGRK